MYFRTQLCSVFVVDGGGTLVIVFRGLTRRPCLLLTHPLLTDRPNCQVEKGPETTQRSKVFSGYGVTRRGSSFIINTDSAESLNYSKNGLEYLATDIFRGEEMAVQEPRSEFSRVLMG